MEDLSKKKIRESIISTNAEQYLKDDMCIDVDDLINKIVSEANPKNYIIFKNFIDDMIKIEFNVEKLSSFINKIFIDFIKSNSITENSNEYFILDNIRHIFISFKKGGIIKLYESREAEVWYPKVIIKTFIGNENDIKILNNPVIIYRGTSRVEYNSKTFGQSWSLSEKIANEFAFKHYRHQPDYKNTIRVVLKTVIDKTSIFYYNKNNLEKEVIVNSKDIDFNNVEVISQDIFKF